MTPSASPPKADPNILRTIAVDDLPNDYGRFLIHGPQGAGKTTLASTIAELGPTLFLDLTGERGTRSFRGAPYAGNVRVARPTSITELDDVFYLLNSGDHPFVAVVIDSLTAVQKMTMRYLTGHDETAVREIQRGATPADMRTWGQALDIMQDVATFWFGLADAGRSKPMHVVMTAQTKVAEDETSGIVSRTPDVQKGAMSLTLAAPDYTLYCDVEDNPEAIGDDTKPTVRHFVRFGSDPAYRIKARVPYNLRGRLPSKLGLGKPLSLVALARTLGLGGVPAPAPTPAPAPAAADETQKEQ